MIEVRLNRHEFEYDIHSLVRAFYPGVEVAVHLEGEPLPRKSIKRMKRDAQPSFGAEDTASGSEEPPTPEKRLDIRFGEASVEARLYDGGGASLAQASSPVGPGTDHKELKNILKSMLYELLSDYTGQKLPWGSLTGIRPVKLAMGLLEQGWENPQIAEYMQKAYHASREKTALAISIANRERTLLQGIDYADGYSLYVGIPFCPSICLYCSFSSSPVGIWRDRVDDYLDALCREIDACAELWRDRKLHTVYIGGGTPTTLEPAQLDRLLTKLEDRFDYGSLREFTVEAGRPDSVTAEKLRVLRGHGISRISINPQTMNQKTLEIIGRKHTPQEIREAFGLARELGFDNINMDLIVGLPGEGQTEVEHTLREVTAMRPDSLTVHSLAVKRAARLNMFRDEYKELSFVNSAAIMDMAADYMAENGLFPYYLYRQKNMAGNFENVGYARPGAEGLYNILIMEEKESILALGAGASTKIVRGDQVERIENVKDIKSYISRIDEMIGRKMAACQGNTD